MTNNKVAKCRSRLSKSEESVPATGQTFVAMESNRYIFRDRDGGLFFEAVRAANIFKAHCLFKKAGIDAPEAPLFLSWDDVALSEHEVTDWMAAVELVQEVAAKEQEEEASDLLQRVFVQQGYLVMWSPAPLRAGEHVELAYSRQVFSQTRLDRPRDGRMHWLFEDDPFLPPLRIAKKSSKREFLSQCSVVDRLTGISTCPEIFPPHFYRAEPSALDVAHA